MDKKELERIQGLEDPNIGFQIPIWKRRVVNPFGDGKESNVDTFIRDNKLEDLNLNGELRQELLNSAPNSWNEKAKNLAGREAAKERRNNLTRENVRADRKSELDLREGYEDRQNARTLANQRLLMEEQRKTTEMQIGSNERMATQQGRNALDLANLQGGVQLQQTRMQGDYGLQQSKVQGDYGLQQSRIQGDYGVRQAQIGAGAGIEQSRIGANSQIRQAEIGARSARDVANISGNWNYRTTDLTSGRQLADSREQRGSDERRQTQQFMAQRQEMGEQRKRQEASELLQSRLGRAQSGKDFIAALINRSYFN